MITSRFKQLNETRPSRQEIRGHLRRIERVSLRHAHKFIIRRLANLRDVQRHAAGWLILVVLLSIAGIWQDRITAAHYTALVPAEGGVYTEGVFGSMDNLNPIFAGTPAERAASRLLFAGLLTYDAKGDLIGELAYRWSSDESGKVYELTLKDGLRWQDGAPLTADDVLFTLDLIKNADTKSSLYASWRNIAVEKVDAHKVRFVLPSPYAAFANSLVVGILPKHVLGSVQPSELRTERYNREPRVASGPFIFQDLRNIDTSQGHSLLRLTANKEYLLGAPKLAGFHLHAYKDREDLTKAFRTQEVASFSDASISQLNVLDPHSYLNTSAPLYNGTYAFLKTDSPLLHDVKVRQALQLATDYQAIIKRLDSQVQSLEGPLLPGQLGYRSNVRQPNLNVRQARELLEQAGWKLNAEGKRQKDTQVMRLRIATLSNGDFPGVTEELMSSWSKLGIEFETALMKPEDIQQSTLIPRSYDVLVYEVAIGRDPDVYAYWHSSQANERGLNLSNYKSPKVDDALESARTRIDPALRDAKYQLFVRQWLADVPAIGLYRPALSYVQNHNVATFSSHPLVDSVDRYFNVRYWAAGHETLRPTR